MPRSVRSLARTLAVVVPVIVGLWHSMHAEHARRRWSESSASDPSLADFFWASFEIETVFAVACFLVALVAWRLTRPRRPDQRDQRR